jgi:integrase/recombinase XerD
MEKRFSPTTIDRKVVSITKYFTCLADNGYLERNPMSKFRHKRQPKDSKVPEFIFFHEMRQIIAAAKRYGDINAKRDAALLATYAFTGCRREEAVNLDWKQINFTNKALLLMRSKTSNFDTLPMHKELYNYLLEYYMERKDCLQRYPDPHSPVFYGDKGNRISLKTVNRLFLKYAKLAGIEREFSITPHVFRNSFCTHLAIQGYSLAEIAFYTGHKDLNSLRKYIKLTVGQYKNIDEYI